MAIITRATLSGYVVRKWKPLVQQVRDWMDSYWHKEDMIPIAAVEGLEAFLNNLPTESTIAAVLQTLLPDTIAEGDNSYVLPAGKTIWNIWIESGSDSNIIFSDADTGENLIETELIANVPYAQSCRIAASTGAAKNILITGTYSQVNIKIYKV
jgi:hypothetical protein